MFYNNCIFVLLVRKLVTVCIEECRLETYLQARNDAGDSASASSQLHRLTAASHKSAIASWLSVFKVNSHYYYYYYYYYYSCFTTLCP